MIRSPSQCRAVVLAGLLLLAGPGVGASGSGIPRGAPDCERATPPPDAGAYATPGGFLLVHPRNALLPGDYSGCKSLWRVEGPSRFPLSLRLYFERGRLLLAQIYDRKGAVSAACDLRSPDDACAGLEANPLSALHLATWPRECIESPDIPACAGEPD